MPVHYYPTKWIHKGIDEYKNPHSRKIYTSVPLQADDKPSAQCGLVLNGEPHFLEPPAFSLLPESLSSNSQIRDVTFHLPTSILRVSRAAKVLKCILVLPICKACVLVFNSRWASLAFIRIHWGNATQCRLAWAIKMEHEFIRDSEICLLHCCTLATCSLLV